MANAFLTGLAQSLTGVADQEASRISSERDRKKRLEEQRQAQDMRFQQQEKLARIRNEVKNAFTAASPEMQKAIDEMRFDDAFKISMQNPADGKVFKTWMDTIGRAHFKAQMAPEAEKQKAEARQAKRAESLEDYEKKRKIAQRTPMPARPRTSKTTPKADKTQEKVLRQKIKALESKIRKIPETVPVEQKDDRWFSSLKSPLAPKFEPNPKWHEANRDLDQLNQQLLDLMEGKATPAATTPATQAEEPAAAPAATAQTSVPPAAKKLSPGAQKIIDALREAAK